MNPIELLGALISVYAVFAFAVLVLCVAIQRSKLAELVVEEPEMVGLAADYLRGPRVGVFAAIVVAYGLAAALTFARAADAVWVFAAALAADVVLFLCWPEQRAYISLLKGYQRIVEAGVVAALGLCLLGLFWLKTQGALT
jgi:hypothetical protein